MATKTINIEGRWVAKNTDGTETDYGGYDLSYEVKSSITDDDELKIVIKCLKFDIDDSQVPLGTTSGRNTICITALLMSRIDKSQYTTKVHDNGYDSGFTDSSSFVSAIKTDIAKASFGSTWDKIEDNVIAFVNVGYQTHESAGINKVGGSKTIIIQYPDKSPILERSSILIASNRFSNWGYGDGNNYHGPTQDNDVDKNPLGPGDICVDTYLYNTNPPLTGETLTNYYPGRIRKDGPNWMSCNRSDGGKARIRKDGKWRDVKNSLLSSGSNNGRIRSDSKWARQKLIGIDKND